MNVILLFSNLKHFLTVIQLFYLNIFFFKSLNVLNTKSLETHVFPNNLYVNIAAFLLSLNFFHCYLIYYS